MTPAAAQDPGYVPTPGGGPGGGALQGDHTYLLGDRVPPVVSAFSFAPARFAVGSAATPERVLASQVRRGTTIRYTVSEQATILMFIQRLDRGRRVGRTCRRATRRLRRRPRCSMRVNVGGLLRSARPGPNSTPFSGRIGTRRLRPGRYSATIVASDPSSLTSKPETARFQIVRARRSRR